MEVPIDQFKTLSDVFGGVLETYLEAYLKEHPDAVYIHVDPNDESLTKLVDGLSHKTPISGKVLRYASSVVLHPDTKFNIKDLERACLLGHLKYAKWLELKPTQRTLDLAIRGDHVEVVQWCMMLDSSLRITPRLLYVYDAINVAVGTGKISDMVFSVACIASATKIAKYIHDKYNIDSNACSAFIDACYGGSLELVKWLTDMYPDILGRADHQLAFQYACSRGNLTVAQWLLDNFNIDIGKDSEGAFRMACSNGHLKTAQWLISKRPETKVNADHNWAFRFACINGHFDVVRWLVSEYPEVGGIRADHDHMLTWACFNGNTEEVKQLVAEYKSDIHANDERVFRLVCRSGCSSLTQWLLDKYPEINIRARNDDALWWACRDGHLYIIKWLVNRYPKGAMYPLAYNAFLLACCEGHLELAKLIFSEFPEINIHAGDDYIFQWVCEHGFTDVAKFILANNTDFDIVKLTRLFNIACHNKSILKLLYEEYPVPEECDRKVRNLLSQ